jgi:hypothetical protein
LAALSGWPVPRCPLGEWSSTEYDNKSLTHHGEVWVEFVGDASYLVFEDAAYAGRKAVRCGGVPAGRWGPDPTT